MNESACATSTVESVKAYVASLQDRVCAALEAEGSGTFVEDAWKRGAGGCGVSRLLRRGEVFEQAVVNVSDVFGAALPASASQRRPELAGRAFRAVAFTVVVHPRNPFVPTSHAHIRFITAERPGAERAWWFAGGFDLTPCYGFEEDVVHWHRVAQRVCRPFGPELYARLKAWCDATFHLRHRDEPRGVGGLFFDDLDEGGFERCFAFARAVGEGYLDAYLPIVRRRGRTPYGEREREFQLYRRGRYVEFNLIHDRGTLFGLQTGGRAESILMSLPPLVMWKNDWSPEVGTAEHELTERYLRPRDWV